MSRGKELLRVHQRVNSTLASAIAIKLAQAAIPANRPSRCSLLYFIESNTFAGHCPAINHELRAAWGEWGDVAWCISHMLDSWAQREYLEDTSETISCYLNPKATTSLKGVKYPLYMLWSPNPKPWGQQNFIRMIRFYVVFLDDCPPQVAVQC